MKKIHSIIVCFMLFWFSAPAQNNLSAWEYWFNNSYGDMQTFSINSAEEYHLVNIIDISALSDGVNVLNIRCKAENNLYSSTLSKMFYKPPVNQKFSKNLAGYEIWFNNDFENRQVNSISADTDHHLSNEVDISTLPNGINVLNIRYKNENNIYSSTLSKMFYKMEKKFQGENAVTDYKYWFDDEYENAVFVLLQTPAKQISILENLDVTHLAMGEHTLHFQVLDELGKWTLIKSDVFTKTAIPEALFSVDNEIACANSPVLFINESTETDSFFWNFGDGNTSDEVEPEHIYAEAGEYQVVLTAIDLASGRENETSQLITVEDCSEACTNLHFYPGWNLFSVPAEPETANLKELFQPLIDNGSLLKIQDEAGNALEDWGMAGGWRNFIGDISPTEGYKIRVTFKDELEVCGLPIKYPFSIPLTSGWNIMGYPHSTSHNALDLIQPLIVKGKVDKVQDEAGNAIEDWGMAGGWRNFIGDFSPGKGYKIKLSVADTLWIQEAYPKSTTILPETVPTSYFIPDFTGNGVDHMNINVTGLPENILQPGDELAVFDGEICVGAKKLLPHHFASQVVSIPASSNDNFGMPGFSEGNTIILKLWRSMHNREYLFEPAILNGTSTFVKHESTLMSLEKYITTGLNDDLLANKPEIYCYPNPFSDEITIEIMLHKEEEIHLDIFNQLGQRIKTISNNQQLPAGSFRFIWNGRNLSNQKVSSGIYYVKFSTDSVQKFHKIILSDR